MVTETEVIEAAAPYVPPLGPLVAALAKAQTEFATVTRDKTVTVQTKTGGSYKFSYAPLDTILAAVRGPLSQNGLVLVQTLDDGALVTSLLHESGASISGRMALPGSNDIQGLGSAITYLRRYAIQAVLGIAAEEDDDGNRATGNTIGRRAPRGSQRPEFEDSDYGAAERQTTHRDGLIGKAIAQGDQDFQLRTETDDGIPKLPFRIKEGALSQIAVAAGPIAVALAASRDEVLNQRVTVWGNYTDEQYDKKDKKTDEWVTITYKVLHVERIKTPAFEMPVTEAPAPATATETPAEPTEAPSEPLPFDMAAVDAETLDPEERLLIAGGRP